MYTDMEISKFIGGRQRWKKTFLSDVCQFATTDVVIVDIG